MRRLHIFSQDEQLDLTYLKDNLSKAGLDAAAGDCGQPAPTIKAINLSKRFGDRVSVDSLNLSVYPAELYALLGDNGAGKTTTLNMLTTLIPPTEGEFYILGYSGARESEKIKGVFGIVSQDVAIYNELTAYENLQFLADLYNLPKAKAKSRIEFLLEQAGLKERANDIVGAYSGGMQRKLAIALALLHEPQVLFMDEPTVGLDPASRHQIWSLLTELRQHGVTILLTTHYLEEAEILADRIGIIREGKLIIEGTIDELRHKIQAIRSIVVRLSRRYEQSEIDLKLARLAAKFSAQARYDVLHNTLILAQPKDLQLPACLKTILAWLEDENIPFTKLATQEPSLEGIYLAVSAQDAAELSVTNNHLQLHLE